MMHSGHLNQLTGTVKSGRVSKRSTPSDAGNNNCLSLQKSNIATYPDNAILPSGIFDVGQPQYKTANNADQSAKPCNFPTSGNRASERAVPFRFGAIYGIYIAISPTTDRSSIPVSRKRRIHGEKPDDAVVTLEVIKYPNSALSRWCQTRET